MPLAIDIGNSRTAFGLYEDGKLIAHWYMRTDRHIDPDMLVEQTETSLGKNGSRHEGIEGVIISNVVPALQEAYTGMAKKSFGRDPIFVGYENAGIEINYPNPAELGADRLVNAVAAYEKFRASVIVIDFGTGTTFDYVDRKGVYHGGAIVAGMAAMNDALCNKAARLPRVGIRKTGSIFGRSTIESIQAGTYHGYIGLVEKIIGKMKEEIGSAPKLISTGGLAPLLAPDLGIEVDEHLTLDGLIIIYERLLKSLATTG